MLNNVHNDGVNGVTQCPIAPGDSYTYEFHATQYGSSWYHSHYSLQYGDGAVGPITIHGPATADFGSNEAFKPILLTDWNHRSVFEVSSHEILSMKKENLNSKSFFEGLGCYVENKLGSRDDKYPLEWDWYSCLLHSTPLSWLDVDKSKNRAIWAYRAKNTSKVQYYFP